MKKRNIIIAAVLAAILIGSVTVSCVLMNGTVINADSAPAASETTAENSTSAVEQTVSDASAEAPSSEPEKVSSAAPAVSRAVSTLSPDHPYYSIIKEAEKYDRTCRPYGQGKNFDGNNRPREALAVQSAYRELGLTCLEEGAGKTIYLTFDVGYYTADYARILDVLKEKGVSATFFFVGSAAVESPNAVRRALAEGHVIGNHSMKHIAVESSSVETVVDNIAAFHDYMKKTYGYEMHLYRPPSGVFSKAVLRSAQLLGYKTVEWSFAYADWDPDDQPDRDEALRTLKERAHDGAIYFLHTTSPVNPQILGEAIDYWRSEGYTVTAYPNE